EKGEEAIRNVCRRVGAHILHGEGAVFWTDLEDHLKIDYTVQNQPNRKENNSCKASADFICEALL
ncbi:hypothetical protein ACQP3C_29880, partial [Escherichia coli]